MYSPDGFVQLSEVFTACRNLAYDRFPPKLRNDVPFEPVPDVRPELYMKLLLERFIDAHVHEMWIFKYPNTLLRASPDLFHRALKFLAPCPESQEEAERALAHINEQSMVFLSKRFRVVADGKERDGPYDHLEDVVAELRPVDGAIVIWKPETWPIEIERALWPFRDEIYFKGHPAFDLSAESGREIEGLKNTYDDYVKVCPDGKEASGLTWREIEKRTGWSRRHIKRAIDTCAGQEGGHISGQGMGK